MSRYEQTRRVTDPEILRRNSYAQAKSTVIEVEDGMSTSVEGAAPPAAELKNAVCEISSVTSRTEASDRYLSDRDVAKRYSVQKQTIWRWAKTSATFPKPFKIEGTTRWSSNELDEYDRKAKEARR